MYTTDQIIGEIIRNQADAEGEFRSWLQDRITYDVHAGETLAADLHRVLYAWDIANEKGQEDYEAAEALALACDDPAHDERFPSLRADGAGHVALHLIEEVMV